MSSDLGPGLEARPVARKLARSISTMPYREAVFLIDKALDHIDHATYAANRDSDFDPGGVRAELEFDDWKATLDRNSRTIVENLEFGVILAHLAHHRYREPVGTVDSDRWGSGS